MKARMFLKATGKRIAGTGRPIPTVLVLLAAVAAATAFLSPSVDAPSGPATSLATTYPGPGAASVASALPKKSVAGSRGPSLAATGAHSSPPPAIEMHLSTVHPGHAWRIETVDSQPHAGLDTSLVLDRQGWPHIAYEWCSPDTCSLRYASFSETGWHTETVDSFGMTGIMPSLAMDALDHPHISYRVGGDLNNLNYAYHDGTRWLTATVDAQGDAGGFSSMALDVQGDPRISYNRDSCLMYARVVSAPESLGQDGTWEVSTVACGSGWYGWCTSLALDPQDRPRISYCDCWPRHDLRYAWYDGSVWQSELVDPVDGFASSLALDGMGLAHIGYMDTDADDLRYAWHDGSSWHIGVVDGQGKVGNSSSLALDANDRPHISYSDETNYALRYTYLDGATWITETVDSGNNADRRGDRTSLALDVQGHPHISYRRYVQSTGSSLCYAHLVELSYAVFLPIVEH